MRGKLCTGNPGSFPRLFDLVMGSLIPTPNGMGTLLSFSSRKSPDDDQVMQDLLPAPASLVA